MLKVAELTFYPILMFQAFSLYLHEYIQYIVLPLHDWLTGKLHEWAGVQGSLIK